MANKIGKIEVFLEDMCPDIISISEHWCNKDNVDMMALKGYKLAANYCRKNYTHNESSLYVKADHVPRVKEIQVEQ